MKGALAPFHQKGRKFFKISFLMARRGKKGGRRYKKVSLSLPKRLYSVLNGIALGDPIKLNRLIKGILLEAISEKTISELESYIFSGEVEEETIEVEEMEGEKA